MTTLAADFSKYQGNPDWSKVAKAISFAILRVQYGANYADPNYSAFVSGCKKNNLPFGSYAYGKFVSITDAQAEAKTFLSRIDKASKFLVVDVEKVSTSNVADLVPATQAFVDACKKAGYKTGLYTGNSFYSEESMRKVKADFLWIPHYGANDDGTLAHSVKPDVKSDLWQFTQHGKLDGVSGDIDLDVLNSDKTLDFFIGPQAVYYTVKQGDILGNIAVKYNTNVEKLDVLNKSVTNVNRIYPGQKLRVK